MARTRRKRIAMLARLAMTRTRNRAAHVLCETANPKARSVPRNSALQPYAPPESHPGPDMERDDELLDFTRRFGVSSYHLSCTARMGPATDGMAVVDDQLRVHGIEGLRVVDASVMPAIPSANICAATMMIAEKAADLIRGRPTPPGVAP